MGDEDEIFEIFQLANSKPTTTPTTPTLLQVTYLSNELLHDQTNSATTHCAEPRARCCISDANEHAWDGFKKGYRYRRSWSNWIYRFLTTQ